MDTHILTALDIDISLDDLAKQIKTGGSPQKILDMARPLLEEVQGLWEPAAVYRWCDFKPGDADGTGVIRTGSGESVRLNLGHSLTFLTHARQVMVALYTVGRALDDAASDAADQGNMLAAYLLDLIGLAALEKTCDQIKARAEETARNQGWGVSPFLSPGSVHGWDLEEQSTLCAILPAGQIVVSLETSGVLLPLKSICALIGIGPDYESRVVGSTCEVCNNRENCQMRQD